MDKTAPVEIERKYVIRMPDIAKLRAENGYTVSDIEQTYLDSEPGVTRRVRKRRYAEREEYTQTKKIRIDKISSFEQEGRIAEQEYLELLKSKRGGTRTLTKTRHTFVRGEQRFEVDVYPEWTRTAILETELVSRLTEVDMPDFIEVIAEVSGDKRYTNAAMSQSCPEELI